MMRFINQLVELKDGDSVNSKMLPYVGKLQHYIHNVVGELCDETVDVYAWDAQHFLEKYYVLCSMNEMLLRKCKRVIRIMKWARFSPAFYDADVLEIVGPKKKKVRKVNRVAPSP